MHRYLIYNHFTGCYSGKMYKLCIIGVRIWIIGNFKWDLRVRDMELCFVYFPTSGFWEINHYYVGVKFKFDYLAHI
jgi:hypothetical protein